MEQHLGVGSFPRVFDCFVGERNNQELKKNTAFQKHQSHFGQTTLLRELASQLSDLEDDKLFTDQLIDGHGDSLFGPQGP